MPRTRARSWVGLLIVTTAAYGAAQDLPYSADEHWEQVCEKAKAGTLKEPSLTGPLASDKLAKCDETELYYGFSGKPNYAAALQCGWYERAHPRESSGNMFAGPGVLTMLYANGKGVQRDYELAIRFACEEPWSSVAEYGSRIGHLEYLRDTKAQATDFDLCDDITSGLSQGICERVVARAADAERAVKIAAIAERLPAAAKALLPALEGAEKAFEEARIETEIDLSGTARAAFEIEDEMKLQDQFLINLQRFARGDVPAASAADLAKLDQQLNAVYRQIQHSSAQAWEFTTVKPEGIRRTQRSWLTLADAWEKFRVAAYPGLSAETMRAQLIRLRLHQLRALAPAE